jgi:hypothetical protein
MVPIIVAIVGIVGIGWLIDLAKRKNQKQLPASSSVCSFEPVVGQMYYVSSDMAYIYNEPNVTSLKMKFTKKGMNHICRGKFQDANGLWWCLITGNGWISTCDLYQ